MDVATMDETVQWVEQRIGKHQFTQHVVVNVAKLVNMRSDTRLRASVEPCDIINIDGMGIVWGARMLGFNVTEKVSGIDLFHELLAMASRRQYPVFLLGARQEIVEKAVTVLKEKYSQLEIAGFHHGYFWDNEEAMVDAIQGSGARLLFVAISSPKKENFINQWKERLGVDFVMGVGGTFDVVTGKVKRAPKWMQISGLEWLFRVIQEPRRMWKRYLVTNLKFAGLLLKEKFRKKAKSQA
jgi:N-acetylglucosaminyldiphosphoundecaprenol N-acetyl-beta-D-mannosaminyltransferase